jgi:TolB-like protein
VEDAPRIDSGLMAVLELTNKLKGAERELVDRNYFSDVVRRAALKAVPRLNLMTRENMEVLAHNMGLTLEQCDEAQCVDTGRKLGADTVINGDILKVGTRFKIVLRLHETKSGRLLSIGEASGKDVDELDQSTEQAVRELFAPLLPAESRHSPPRETQAPAQAAPAPVQAAPQPAFSACPSGYVMLAGDCKPQRVLRTAMKICPFEGTYAFCNDQDGNITENTFIAKYKGVTGESNLDKNFATRRSTIGPAVITALGITGVVTVFGTSIFNCSQSDITSGSCPAAVNGTCPAGTTCRTLAGVGVGVLSAVMIAGGIGWAAWAIIHMDGTPDDHNISRELAVASVDEYNRKLK